VNPCSRCSNVTAPACARTDAGGRVLVYAPAPPAFGKARSAATDAGYHVEMIAESVLLLNGPVADWTTFVEGLDTRLSTVEAADTRIAPIGGLPLDGHAIALAALTARTLPMLLAEVHDVWLPRALAAGALTSHFQPIVNVPAGEIFAHEALIRTTAEDGSIINGGAIVEAGRRLGALHVLDQIGRTSAIRCAHTLGLTSSLFVNFFPTVVYDPVHCLATTRVAMRETGIQPAQIVFEVVESEHILDRQHLLDILTYYRKEGFRVALDDLGSGYSSLNLLVALRPDFVKLDIELVRGAATDPLRRALVEALVRTAQESGIQVIAEGVETVATARVLTDVGVELMQGYLFGRPSPAAGALSTETLAAVREA